MQIYRDGGGAVEKKAKICVLFAAAVLCVILFCLTSYAQSQTRFPHCTHEYVSQILVPASEREQGKAQNTCIYCGDAYIEYLPATGHVFGPWITAAGSQGWLERRSCSQCGRSEERVRPGTPAVSEKPSAEQENAWGINSMDYVLTAATGGVWGYAAIALWWNSLVLVWYKKECLCKKKEKENDAE